MDDSSRKDLHEIESKDFRVLEGDDVHLEKWPTRVDPVYKPKDPYKSLLEEHIAKLSAPPSDRHAILLTLQATDAGGKTGPSVRLGARSVRVRHILGSKPSARKAGSAKTRDEIGALTHKTPDETGAIIFDHQDNRPLVDSKMIRRYPGP